jgi:MFS family permease
LPRLAREFHIAKGHAGLLVTVYLVAMLVGQPLAGRLGDAIGVRRLAAIAVVGFGVFSAGAMVSGSFAILVACRGAQAAFASAIIPAVQAMLRAVTTPEERGRAFGVQGSVLGVGAGLGPVVGGLLITVFGWRAIFGVNIPIVLVVLVVLRRTVPAAGVPHAEPEHPAVSRERLTSGVFLAACSTQALATLAQYALLLVTPLLLDDRGWGSGRIGLALSLLTLGLIVMSPPGGRLGDVRGRRFPVLAGLAVGAVAVGAASVFGDHVATGLLLVTLLLFGVGLGTATPGITTAGLEAVPASRIGFASGLLSASRYVGSITASILLAILVDDNGRGIGTMLVICVAGLLAAIATALRLPGRTADRDVGKDRVSDATGRSGSPNPAR